MPMTWPPLPTESVQILLLPGATAPAGYEGQTQSLTAITAAHELPAGAFDVIVGAAARPNWLPALARLLAPAGRLYLQPRLAPGTRLRGKKARQTAAAADYLNACYAFVEPDSLTAFGQPAWERAAAKAGLIIDNFTTVANAVDSAVWGAQLNPNDKIRLAVLLRQAPPLTSDFLTPQFSGDRITFHMIEARIELRASG